MKEITLDELYEYVKEIEAKISEPTEVTANIDRVSKEMLDCAAKGKPVTIISDYDADGICSAYIISKTLRTINPDKDFNVSVMCNDRRNSYGISHYMKTDPDTRYIVLDMGSNELDYVKNNFGKDTIIIDHHIINEDEIKQQFQKDSTLLNPHSMCCEDGKSADYCTTGLAYRIYKTLSEQNKLIKDEKLDNTIGIIACIGTVSDMVNVIDEHSYNRQIIREGMKLIDNADENNIDFTLGYILAKNGINEFDCSAHQVAFNIGSFLNSASRMSEIIEENGAQRMYNALSGDSQDYKTYEEIDELCQINAQRKEYANSLRDENYHIFVHEERTKNLDSNICVYMLPDDTPNAFCGLLAGKLCEATDKAVICLSYNTQNDNWSGSGRNATGQSSLKKFLDDIIDTPEAKGIKMKYGGHEDAIGISQLNNAMKLYSVIYQNRERLQSKPERDVLLKIDLKNLNKSTELLDKVRRLEPIGEGFKLPPVLISGRELRKTQGFVKGHKDWKKIQIKEIEGYVYDWSYSAEKYPQEKNAHISFLAELSQSNFKNPHLELSAINDRAFYKSRIKKIELSKSEEKIK